ncbi:MAG: DUF2905 domain-containing protein [Candidatus Binatia bacterium]
MAELGKVLIVVGAVILLVGVVVVLAGRIPGMPWIGRLPGDFTFRRNGVVFYFPLTSCLLVSVLLSLLVSLFRR